MRRLFEGGYYSKYRRRDYYLFQLYRNVATIRGWLLFEVQTRLLFISALPQCGDYSRAATIYFSSTAMWRLFEGDYYLFQLYRNAATIRGRLLFITALPQCGDYSRVATIRSTDAATTIYFSSTAMRRLFEGGYYLLQLYRNAATIRGWLLFEVQTPRLLFISALPQCGNYSRVATIRSTDATTIYFSSTAMWRLFEGSYYLFQLYRNVATIRGRLLFISALPQCGDYSRVAIIRNTDAAITIYFSYTAMRRLFEVQTSQLLFILALPQCSDYSRAATIRSTDVAATIYFSATAMWRLLFVVQTLQLLFISALPQCGDYSRAATICSTDVVTTIYFSSTAMRRLLFEVQTSQLLFITALPQCGDYSRAATIYFSSTAMWRLLFVVQTLQLLFISALPQCGDYSRAATIRSTDVAATIYFSSTAMRRLFEGGYYSKYRRRGYYSLQRYRNVATIRGRLLFEVRCLFEEIQYLSMHTAFGSRVGPRPSMMSSRNEQM